MDSNTLQPITFFNGQDKGDNLARVKDSPIFRTNKSCLVIIVDTNIFYIVN